MSHLSRMTVPRNVPTFLLIASWLSAGSVLALVPASALPTNSPSVSTSSASGPADTAAPGPDTLAEDAPSNSTVLGTTNVTTPPFKAIAIRNVFGIKDPPVAVPTPEPPPTKPQPPPNVFLTGFSSWKGVKKVYLQVTRPGAKAPDYLDLRVGDAQFGIKILEIDEHEESAKILNDGLEVVLNFKENGLKAGGGPVPNAIPGPVTTAANTGINNPRMASQPGGIPQPPTGGGGPTIIGRGGVTQSQAANIGLSAPNVLAAGFPDNADRVAAVNRDLPARRGGTPSAVNPNMIPVGPNEIRVIQGRVIPPPPPLPVDPNSLPGN